MKRKTAVIVVLCLLALGGIAYACQSAFWCDYHYRYAYFTGYEYTAGGCFCVYKHQSPGCKLVVKCD